MIDTWVEIEDNRKVNLSYYKLVFRSRRLALGVKPGQFLNLQTGNTGSPFLRRPFSYYRRVKNKIEILYEVVGKGTAQLAQMKKGNVLKALGPLGKPFTFDIKKKKRVLIGGGVGVPPLIFLAEVKPQRGDYLLIGTKSKKEVLPSREFSRVKAKILCSTDDGSYGQKGFVTELLKEIIRCEDKRNLYIQTCGPTPMMQEVMKIAQKEGIAGEVSVEKTMACGLGVCLGCMVKTPEGWLPSCTQGPVFKFEDILEL